MKEKKNKRRAFDLRMDGMTYAAIGLKLGISRQRVQQLLRPPVQIYNTVRSRAKNRCEECNILLRVGDGHVHHRNTTGSGPDEFNCVGNLQYLCRSCHRRMHSKEA